MRTVENMNAQIHGLKNAIGTLADLISQEIEDITRTLINTDIEHKFMQTHLKIEGLQA